MMWCRSKEVSKSINENHVNPKRFKDVKMPESITCTNDVSEAVKNAAIVI